MKLQRNWHQTSILLEALLKLQMHPHRIVVSHDDDVVTYLDIPKSQRQLQVSHVLASVDNSLRNQFVVEMSYGREKPQVFEDPRQVALYVANMPATAKVCACGHSAQHHSHIHSCEDRYKTINLCPVTLPCTPYAGECKSSGCSCMEFDG